MQCRIKYSDLSMRGTDQHVNRRMESMESKIPGVAAVQSKAFLQLRVRRRRRIAVDCRSWERQDDRPAHQPQCVTYPRFGLRPARALY